MWMNFQQNRKFDKYFTIDEEKILQSHRRCEEVGVPKDLKKPLFNRNLTALRTAFIPLIKYADLLFLDTQRHISDTSYVFILTDADGYILTTLTDPDVFSHILKPCGIVVAITVTVY